MKKTQSSRLNAFLAVQKLLISNPTQVASVVALQESADELTDLIMNLNTNVRVQASPSGAAEAKAEALTELGDVAFEIAGALLSLAEANRDRDLAARVNFSRSSVVAGSANAIVARCQNIVDAALENLAALSDHGVTQNKVAALKQKLKSYDTLRLMPRQAKAAAAAATRGLERLFPEVNRLLVTRMDKLIWQFRKSAPDFYDKYQVARSIVDAATHNTDEAVVVVPVIQPAPQSAPNAKAA